MLAQHFKMSCSKQISQILLSIKKFNSMTKPINKLPFYVTIKRQSVKILIFKMKNQNKKLYTLIQIQILIDYVELLKSHEKKFKSYNLVQADEK